MSDETGVREDLAEALGRRVADLEARERRRTRLMWRFVGLAIIGAVAFPFAAEALDNLPQFMDGERITAASMNSHFQLVVDGVTAVETRTASLEARPQGLYCGRTDPVGGNIVGVSGVSGWRAARTYCEAEPGCGPTAHMCSIQEMELSYALGMTVTSGSTYAWVGGPRVEWGGALINDCSGPLGMEAGAWTSVSAMSAGWVWHATLGRPEGQGCFDVNVGIFCCN